MHATSRRTAGLRQCALAMVCATLVACGGGGNDGGTKESGSSSVSASSFQHAWLSFAQSELSLVSQAGSVQSFLVLATLSRLIEEILNVVIEDNGGVVIPTGTVITQLNPQNFQATLSVSPNLAVGVYRNSLTIKLCLDNSSRCLLPVPGSPWTIPYSLIVSPNAWGAQTAAPLSFAYAEGGRDSHAVQLVVTGPGKSWSVVSKPAWLALSQTSGVTPSTLSASAQPGLARGSYSGNIVFATPTGESASLSVTLMVTAPA